MTDTFMTQQEMKATFPNLSPKAELVMLTEHDGEHVWQRDRDGWHRLDCQPCGAVTGE